MEVHSLVELIVMENGTEIIVNKTTVEQDPHPYRQYFVRIDGLFKYRKTKNFFPAHLTVELYIIDTIGSWATRCTLGDTFSFFELSSGHKPSERAQFLCHCLRQKDTFNQIVNDFGTDSEIYKWIEKDCPILLEDTPQKKSRR